MFPLTIAVLVVICIFICTICYIRIDRIVFHHQLQINAQQQAVQGINTAHNLNMVRSKRSAVNTFVYFILMIMCYYPVLISILILAISPEHWSYKSWILAETVVYLNSSINPFLFCWRLSELGIAVLIALRRILRKDVNEG